MKKETNPHGTAFPFWEQGPIGTITHMVPGLTKREYFAGQALAGLLAQDDISVDDAADLATVHADALIDALNEPQPSS